MERDLKPIRIQTEQPSRDGRDRGKIEEAQYVVDGGYMQLRSLDGLSMGPEHRRKLPPNLLPDELAARMLARLLASGARPSIDRCGINR
jgi:hypothetical protein